ncbi:MAG: ATPase domain-containing protein [Thermoplasmata archaeon]|nr:ATPase domain-containing protein [Thermoplasmata archaeon]
MSKTETKTVLEEETPLEGVVPSYIGAFDEILGGGIPRGHVVLVSGLPGTMKSTLAYSILYHNGAEEGRTSLYITLEQRKQSLQRQMASMGFDLDRVSGQLHILDVATLQKRAKGTARGQWVDFLQRAVEFRKELDVVDLIVVDSLEALEVLAQFEDRRHDLFRLFDWFRSQRATALLITEAPPEPFLPGLFQASGNEADYLADGILHLKMHEVSDVDVQRRIRIVKMRAADHKTGSYALVFDQGRFSVTRAMSGNF